MINWWIVNFLLIILSVFTSRCENANLIFYREFYPKPGLTTRKVGWFNQACILVNHGLIRLLAQGESGESHIG